MNGILKGYDQSIGIMRNSNTKRFMHMIWESGEFSISRIRRRI